MVKVLRVFVILLFSNFLITESIETFYKTGELMERYTTKNGVRDGTYQKWYLNGQIGKQSHYKNGILDGQLITWYPNGIVKATYPITDGSLEGTAKYYDENGNISWQVYETNRPNLQNKIDLSGWCLN